MQNNIFSVVVSAPSGSGKTTIIRKLLKNDDRFEFSVSTTTREQREGEIAGMSYYYISKDEFTRKIDAGEFLEWAIVHGNYYGTTKKEIDRIQSTGKISIFDVDVQGGRQLREKLDNAVFIFIVPPTPGSLQERLVKRRTETENQIRTRLGNAVTELQEYSIYDYLVLNENVDDAVSVLKTIIEAEQYRTKRMKHILQYWGL